MRAKQNILSIGEDIANWSPSGSAEKYNLHIYYPNDVNDQRIRFSAVSNVKYGGTNRRSMGIIKPDVFEFNETTNYFVIIKFDKNGFYINDHLITRDDFISVEASKTPEIPKQANIPPEIWTYPDFFMQHFQNVVSVGFGSMEGTVRSYAYYEYIKYHHNL